MARASLLLLLVASLFGPIGTAAAADLVAKSVEASPPPYETIAFVSEGPTFGHTSGSIRGRYHRVLLLNAGLAYERPVIRFEAVTYGDEVCCRRVTAAWVLDLNDLEKSGVVLPDAATTELQFRRWLAAESAEFRYGKLTCRFSGIGSTKISASCTK